MISVNDLISLTVWNLNHFLIVYFQFHPEFASEIWCKIAVFTQYFSLEYSAWLLVLLTLDRYFHVRNRINKPNFNRISREKGLKKTIALCLIVGSIIFILNSNLLILNGYTLVGNNTKQVICYRSKYLTEEYIIIWHRVISFFQIEWKSNVNK